MWSPGWRMKQTVRDKYEVDRAWLRAYRGMAESPSSTDSVTVPRWLWFSVLGVAVGLALGWGIWWVLRDSAAPG